MNPLPALRAWLAQRQLDAFILPRGDQYLGEYVAAHDEMLAWLTGFTGSAGFALVTARAASLYTDGRYQTQGMQELQNSGFELRHSGRDKWDEDLVAAHHAGAMLAFDPWLHSVEWHTQTEKKFANTNISLRPLPTNPIDVLWTNRPAPPRGQAEIHPIALAGESSAEKCAQLGLKLQAQNIAAEFVNDPTLVAWLLNIRGDDIPHIPVAQARAILHASGQAELFIAPEKVSDNLRTNLAPHISIHDPAHLLLRINLIKDKKLKVPAGQSPYALLKMAEASGVATDTSPSVIFPARAVKNSIEIAGARTAHARDGNALTKFFVELPTLIARGITEFEIAQKLAAARTAQPGYVSESFPAIVGWQGNGAIVHYRPHETGSAHLTGDGILLIDSGGQYRCGTTDITRTLAVGTPTARQRDIYTRVLKGHLAIARVQFPIGTSGHQLDALARQFLWEAGLDYDHGTGHGVGSFLSVHEGPQSISNRPNPTTLVPGMILSNEPGCYLPGEFGVRLENLVLVVPSDTPNFLCFETLTRVPYDNALIDRTLLSPQEITQIDAYHADL